MKEVEIHITGKCLNNCIFCSVNKHYNPEPTLKEIYKDIDRTLNNNFSRITITGGEPALHEDLLKIVKYAKHYYKNILIETNGTNFTKEYVSQLIAAGITEFKISFHSHNRTTFSKISQNKNSFYVALNALSIFQQFKKHIKVSTNTVITKHNYKTLSEMIIWLNTTFPYLNKIRISYPRFYNFKKDYCKKEIVSLPITKHYLAKIKKLNIKKVFLENVPLCICNYPHPSNFTWELYLSHNKRLSRGLEYRKYLPLCDLCKLKKNARVYINFIIFILKKILLGHLDNCKIQIKEYFYKKN